MVSSEGGEGAFVGEAVGKAVGEAVGKAVDDGGGGEGAAVEGSELGCREVG